MQPSLAVVLKIHDTPIRFSVPDAAFVRKLTATYAPLACDERPTWEVQLHLVETPDRERFASDFAPLPQAPPADRVFLTTEAAGHLDAERRAGVVQLARPAAAEAFHHLFWLLYFQLAVDASKVLVHAAAVVKDEKASGASRQPPAFLFAGPSQAGKSTIVRMLGEVRVLHDDVVSVELLEGRPMVRTPPFADYRGLACCAPALREVGAVYFVTQSRRAALQRIGPRAAFARLLTLPLAAPAPDSAPYLRASMEVLGALVARCPCFELAFSLSELPEGIFAVDHDSQS